MPLLQHMDPFVSRHAYQEDMNDESNMVLEKFEKFRKHGHLQLHFRFQHGRTTSRLETAGYILMAFYACGDMRMILLLLNLYRFVQ